MRRTLPLYFLAVMAMSSSCNQPTYIDNQTTFQIFEKRYSALRQNIRDSLAPGMRSINDFGLIYTPAQRDTLNTVIKNFKDSTGLQIAIVTLDSTMSSPDSVADVTRIIGVKNGVNTTIGISKAYKTMHIWNDSLVNTTMLTQKETKAIIDHSFIPQFKNAQFYQGTLEGLKTIIINLNLHDSKN